MKEMGLNELREAYLKFFEEKGHLRLESASLVPKNDKSLLLINAGMAPLKPYFTGLETPPKNRITTCQKCVRTGDIDNVGTTARHATFFEMLGNFSFGDYFKEEVIPWAWEFITEVLKIPKEKLYVTIYLDDDEAYDIWTLKTNIDKDRIFRLGKEDNFWEHGAGPCGPCTEIHYDRFDARVKTAEDFIKASDEDKIVEFWNLVFTQFDGDGKGNYEKLKSPNIDTGMGLERIATIMQGKNSIFEVDTMENILNEVSRYTNVKYGDNKKEDISLRIITDHVRSITFLISDGVIPSNEGRGYVLRRLLRRAARHGKQLGVKKAFLCDICDVVIRDSERAYPILNEKKDYIKKIIKLEEDRFHETIDSGIEILNTYIVKMKESGTKTLSGEKVFKLYDTFGFPVELTQEILKEHGFDLDILAFEDEMKMQRERARSARNVTNYMGADVSVLDEIDKNIITEFDGYDNLTLTSKISCIICEDTMKASIKEGQTGVIVTENTPFYAEMGGQIGDIGTISKDNFKAKVVDTKKNISGKIVHFVEVDKGEISTGDNVILTVDSSRRNKIRRYHTATHILNKALINILGNHVTQAGSLVTSEKLRFDFTHFEGLKNEEIKKVEDMVNAEILKMTPVSTEVMTIDEAKSIKAIANFDDKYDDEVRVVKIGDYSSELCGGTHIDNTGKIGKFKILSESGIAAGTRRIEALVHSDAFKYVDEKLETLQVAASILKCNEKDLLDKIKVIVEESKNKDKEIFALKSQMAGRKEDDIIKSAKDIKGLKVASYALEGVDNTSLRDLCDKVKDKLGEESIVLLGSVLEDRVALIAMAGKLAVAKGVHCGNLIREISQIVGGKGGGKPNMAQAGGKDSEKLDEAIEKVYDVMENLVK